MNQIIPGEDGGGAAIHAVCSSSGGKDSLLAMWEAKRQGVELRTLLTMFDETGERSRSHSVPREIMELQARALGLEFVGPSASWADYESVFVRTLRELRATGHGIAVFGDIDLEPHREWEERVCASAGVQARLPLWHRNRRELAEQALAASARSWCVLTRDT